MHCAVKFPYSFLKYIYKIWSTLQVHIQYNLAHYFFLKGTFYGIKVTS